MSAGLAELRDELRALTGRYMEGAVGPFKARCLALIDRVATCATDMHREIPVDVLAHLTRAMHAAAREDVVGVIEEIEVALAILGNPQRPHKAVRGHPPSPPPREGRPQVTPARNRAKRDEARTLADTIDPLLARLRAKAPKR